MKTAHGLWDLVERVGMCGFGGGGSSLTTMVGHMNGHAEAARALCLDWLAGVDASSEQERSVVEDVAARLDDLPSALRLGARLANTAIGLVPRQVQRFPVISEYVRLVHSLTAVSYYDVVTRTHHVTLPRQRTAAAHVGAAISEPRT